MTEARTPWLILGAALWLAALIASGLNPYDRLTWTLEVLPAAVALPLLYVTARRYPLTTLLYCAALAHALVLMLGGAYTYARVPLGFELAHLLGLERNPYDKIGHFFQGAVPALIAREILIRGAYVRGKKMLILIVLSIVLAISASYELIEWAAALIMGQGADEFLGTQGDVWDTQSDMFFALIGACTCLLLFAKLHDQQLQRFLSRTTPQE